MTIPVPTFGPNGFIIPTDADILTAVKDEINTAFGGNLNMASETPQGQLAVTMTASISNAYQLFLKYSQQLDPSYADGREQDALARIYFIERISAQSTTVVATCGGLEGTVIPDQALAMADDGNTYICSGGGTIPVSGAIDLTFYCATVGPIPCPVGSLSTIYRTVAGWDSITNAGDGVLGRDTETRAQFEERRFASVQKNSLGSLGAIYGSVLGVSGVLDAYVTENFTAAPVVVGGYTLAAHSVYVAAVGGSDADVATAIWSKKSPGCAMNGNTSVTVYDTVNYEAPYPSYTISFERPSSLEILFAVNIVNSTQVPSDAAAQVQTAIIDAFSGASTAPRARIGSTIYAADYYGPIAALGDWARIVSVQIGSQNTPAAEVTGFIDDGTGGGAPSGTAGDVLTVTSVASGTVAVNQTVIGAGVTSGTIITADTGGGGGAGTYTVGIAQKVLSETLYGVLANQNSVDAQIDQAPATDAARIVVTLS